MVGLAVPGFAAEINLPATAVAHTTISIGTSGQGNGTLYVIGPSTRIRHSITLGREVQLKPEDLGAAGQYTVILRAEGGTASKALMVLPGPPANLSFLAQPSRVPADTKDVISGTAFVMDSEHNLAAAPTQVKFVLEVADAPALSRSVTTRAGIAWTRIDSSRRAGNAQFTAALENGAATVKRVVQLVASEPCNLRMHAQALKNGIEVETEPVRDCTGNLVPDGTVVTFTDVDAQGKSTVDAVIKQGSARAVLPADAAATISVASGVVPGNEIQWREK